MPELKEFRGIEGTSVFENDRGFRVLLEELLPESERAPVFDNLNEWSRNVFGRWDDIARETSRNENLPRIQKFDRVGSRIEKVELHPLTRQLRREVAEAGVLTWSLAEIHKFAIIYYLAHNGEASLTCGLACTDGLIRALEAKGSDFLRDTYAPLLRSAEYPMAGAQFVTERAGGSDVGAIEATAEKQGDGSWRITGEKWYCSNPDEFFLVAARPDGAPAGTRGVGVFLVPRVLSDGSVNGISFKRLKDKLGTRSLPTAEIDFEGATGWAIGEPEEGFKTLMNYVINVSRIHNAVSACGIQHRAFIEARNYARQREAFGETIISYPLVQESLLKLLERCWRDRVLTFRLISLIDRNGLVPEDEDQAMWQRFLINLAKYRTASHVTSSVREAILVFGANGIVEDFSVLPRLLRDSMIIETWEGTHNTLCLQIMRDAGRSSLLRRWESEVAAALERWPRDFLRRTRKRVDELFVGTRRLIESESMSDPRWVETHARRFVDRLGVLLELAWMGEFATRHAASDSTAAVLTSLATHELLNNAADIEHPLLDRVAECVSELIDERSFKTDVESL